MVVPAVLVVACSEHILPLARSNVYGQSTLPPCGDDVIIFVCDDMPGGRAVLAGCARFRRDVVMLSRYSAGGVW